MNQREARREGYDRGFTVASWIDVPELGSKIPADIDWEGYRSVTKENFLDVMAMLANQAEANGRQYSPFEETANALNSSRNPDEVWEAFEEGILAGINANLKSRKLKNYYKEG